MSGLLNPTRTEVLSHGVGSGSNAVAEVILAATAGIRWQILAMFAGYSAAAAVGASLTVTWTKNGVVEVFTWWMPTATGSQDIPLPYGAITGDDNTSLTVSLSAGGAGVVGT